MKKIFIIGLALSITGAVMGQKIDEKEKDLRAKVKGNTDSTKTWSKGGILNLGFGQTSLHNWAAGGLNNYSFNGLLSLYANHSKGKLAWDNSLDLEFGTIKQFAQGEANIRKWFKNSDRIELNSKLGYEAGGDWYYAALLNFRTQFTEGLNNANNDSTTKVISDFLAPAYTTFALGMDYRPSDNFSVFIGPLSYRMVHVGHSFLRTTYGLPDSVKMAHEVGAYLKMNYKKNEPFGIKSVNFQTDLAMFSNYLKEPQNIDIYWNTIIGMKVNKYITATIGTNFIYDHDIQINTGKTRADGTPEIGPRAQFKQALTVGFSRKF